MAVVLSPIWGPFMNGSEASARLNAFVDKACGPGVGVVWSALGAIYPLRAPRRDAGGFGDVVVFEWSTEPPPSPKPPTGFWDRTKAFITDCLEQEGRAAELQSQADMAMGRALGQAVDRMVRNHRDDGVGVALDILCIGLSIALLPTGLGALGVLALAGGVVLLASDGAAYASELAGDDQMAEAIKKKTEVLRIIATVATLPDAVFGGIKAVQELREVSALLPRATRTAASAESMAARTANAARAERFAQIAQRAHLRAQLRQEQIFALLRLEIAPRGAGSISTGLLMREEITGDHSTMNSVVRRLRLHMTATHR